MRLGLRITAIILGLPSIVLAADNSSCDRKKHTSSCTPVYACIGDQGEYFSGLAFGKESGTLLGNLYSGASCVGRWSSLEEGGPGKLRLTCKNGAFMQIFYTKADSNTQTAIGQGISTDGRFVTAWTGPRVNDFFSKENGWPEGTLACGTSKVPLG